MEHTRKGPGRPTQSGPPLTCSGVPMTQEEMEERERARLAKKKLQSKRKLAGKAKSKLFFRQQSSGETSETQPVDIDTSQQGDGGCNHKTGEAQVKCETAKGNEFLNWLHWAEISTHFDGSKKTNSFNKGIGRGPVYRSSHSNVFTSIRPMSSAKYLQDRGNQTYRDTLEKQSDPHLSHDFSNKHQKTVLSFSIENLLGLAT